VRNEIQEGDRIVLVGHSTGGLDIRCLLRKLIAAENAPTPTDGRDDWAVDGRLLQHIERVVFLSVPHRGTNIADWVSRHRLLARVAVGALRGGLHLSHRTPVKLARLAMDRAAKWSAPDLVLAGMDVVNESSSVAGQTPLHAAEARQSFAAVDVWLQNMHEDFFAVDDLASQPVATANVALEAEARALEARGIETLSFVTRGAPPAGNQPPSSELRSLSDLLRVAFSRDERTDLFYRGAHYLCQAGPFASGSVKHALVTFGEGREVTIHDADNDGIVNTASMLWPRGETFLVQADHGDIIGHRQRVAANPDVEGRAYRAYDLLKSSSGFGQDMLEGVWQHVLRFAVASHSTNRRFLTSSAGVPLG